LGWLYGVRLWVRGEQGAAVNAIAAEYEKKLTALQQKFDSQLTATQRALDEVSLAKNDLRRAQTLMAEKDASIVNLQSAIADLRVSKASIEGKLSAINTGGLTHQQPANQPHQLPVKLTATDRRNRIVEIVRDGRIVEGGEEKPITISGLARTLNAAVNTIKADLKELEPVIEVNGSIHLRGSH
jgi:chromosome segregation ATPase